MRSFKQLTITCGTATHFVRGQRVRFYSQDFRTWREVVVVRMDNNITLTVRELNWWEKASRADRWWAGIGATMAVIVIVYITCWGGT